MTSELTITLVVGLLGMAGGLGGVFLGGYVARGTEKRRIEVEDARRWLTDRRSVYANFLGLAQAMLAEIDSFAIFLSRDEGTDIGEGDEGYIREGLFAYFQRWQAELQPILGEIELLATPHVADLADRVSGALMDITSVVEQRGSFDSYYPDWFRCQDLFEVLRDAMRKELGLDSPVREMRSPDWPWLPDRPSREKFMNH
jgi:hypothetical protein